MGQLENKVQRRKEIADSLSGNRFKLPRDPELRERIAKLREVVNEFSVNHPEFISFQSFGSLLKGYGTNESDVDAIVVLDQDIIDEEKKRFPGLDSKDIIERLKAREKLWLDLRKKIMEVLNFSEDKVHHIKHRVISKKSIKESLVQAPWNLEYLFYPAIGATKIRSYRKIIFDELEARGEQGERVWQSIMDRLCLRERGGGLGGMKSKYLYPQTIAEGKKRFL